MVGGEVKTVFVVASPTRERSVPGLVAIPAPALAGDDGPGLSWSDQNFGLEDIARIFGQTGNDQFSASFDMSGAGEVFQQVFAGLKQSAVDEGPADFEIGLKIEHAVLIELQGPDFRALSDDESATVDQDGPGAEGVLSSTGELSLNEPAAAEVPIISTQDDRDPPAWRRNEEGSLSAD